MNYPRDQHLPAVQVFLRQQVANQAWQITRPPHGTGQETYFASGQDQEVFIKLGARVELYRAAAQLVLAPPLIAAGCLQEGTSILVQQRIQGHMPTRQDFQRLLRQFAQSIRSLHGSQALQQHLAPRLSHQYRDVGLEMLVEVEQRWQFYAPCVPSRVAGYVNEKMEYLKNRLGQLQGSGLVASHSDPCNANWLVSDEERVYLLDFEAMRLDDPALDLGAVLWWYYPPDLRPEFLALAGCPNDADFRERMRVRMAVHNLHILLPCPDSFDRFDPHSFEADLVDFRAVVEGNENPQGYQD